MRFEKYLINEKTYNIGQDVDLIYNKLIKSIMKLFHKGKYKEFENEIRNKQHSMYSDKLKSRQTKQAHEINPVTISFVHNGLGNHYNPIKGYIQISLNKNVMDLLAKTNYEEFNIKRDVGSMYERFMNELSESSIKGSIYHELSHWLNDTFHNQQIKKMIKRAGETGDYSITKKGHQYTTLTDYELDAQIHAVKQVKRDNNKKYDQIDWKELMILKPALHLAFERAAFSNEYDEYMKRFTKRLHREKLLNKKLQNIPSDKEMMLLIRRT